MVFELKPTSNGRQFSVAIRDGQRFLSLGGQRFLSLGGQRFAHLLQQEVAHILLQEAHPGDKHHFGGRYVKSFKSQPYLWIVFKFF